MLYTADAFNFNKHGDDKIDDMGSPYDTNSVMQYGGYSLNLNDQPTLMNKKTQEPVSKVRYKKKVDGWERGRDGVCFAAFWSL